MRRLTPWVLATSSAVLVAAVVVAVVSGDGSGERGRPAATGARAPSREGRPGAAPAASPASRSEPEPGVPGIETLERARRLARRPRAPAELAAAIRLAEAAVRSPATPEADLPAWGTVHQLAYRQLARRPEWDGPVQERVGPKLAADVRANVTALRELWALTAPRDELPDWRIVAPPPAEELLAHYHAAEARFGVPWTYLAAIHLVESRMGRIRGRSTAGARGPMQFLPSTWARYGEGDIEDAGDSIRAAARYLVAHGAPGDMASALFAYNRSRHYVAAVEAYHSVMARDAAAYRGYYWWPVYYRLTTGDVVLPEGWSRTRGHPGRREHEGEP